MNELKQEEFERLKAGRQFPDIKPGDSIEIEKLPYISATEPDVIKGLVVGLTHRASDTSIRTINVNMHYDFLSHNKLPVCNFLFFTV